MKEATLSHFVMDMTKISNPGPIYCFLLHRWVHICLETAFMDSLLSCLLFVCLGPFFDSWCNPKVACGDQTATYKETAGCTRNCSLFLTLSSFQPRFYFSNENNLPFAAVTICYDLACQLCVFTFLDVRGIWIRVIEFLFEWQACASIYTVFRRLFLQ